MEKCHRKQLSPELYEDPESIPASMRTIAERKSDDRGFHTIEPITTLRRAYLGIVAEIVRISYYIKDKEDGDTFYQVNYVTPCPIAFDRKQPNTISVGCSPNGRENSDMYRFQLLMKDVESFVRDLEHRDRQRCQISSTC